MDRSYEKHSRRTLQPNDAGSSSASTREPITSYVAITDRLNPEGNEYTPLDYDEVGERAVL